MAKPKAPYRIVWRPVAKADLDNIVGYIAEDSSIRAGQFSAGTARQDQAA